jgi:site-specific DNA-methyltransferase (adenine-specific)
MKIIEKFKNKIINAECVEVMKEMPNECIDMILTSPPYDNLRNYTEYSFNFKKIAKELFRIIKDGGVVVWVVGDATIKGSETGTSFKQALYFKKIGFNLYDTMIYEKNSFSHPDKYRYYQVWEYMFIFSKGKPKTINLIKDKKNKWPGSWGSKKIREKNGELKNYKKKIICGEFGVRHNEI